MRFILLPLLLATIALTLMSCAPCEECGTLKRQNDITVFFQNSEIVPGYRYYFSGRTEWPSAVMALDASYTIKSEFWR